MRILSEMFPDAKGYATQKNAQAKLSKFAAAIPEDGLTATVQRPDGRWLAVVIKRDRDIINIPFLCHNGICITN